MADLGKSFSKFVNNFFPNYRGVVIERSNGGWNVLGQWCSTMEEVDKVIDDRIKALNLSLNRIKTQQ